MQFGKRADKGQRKTHLEQKPFDPSELENRLLFAFTSSIFLLWIVSDCQRLLKNSGTFFLDIQKIRC